MLKRILQDFLRNPGVIMAGVIGKDGFVIEYATNGEVDVEAVAAMASSAMGTAESVGKEVGRGDADTLIMEYKGGNILISPVSENEIITVVSDSSANLGRIRYEIKKQREKIRNAL